MRLAISNIAWDVGEDAAVAELLRKHGVDAIDVAPGKYFPSVARATDAEVDAVRKAWADRGISILGMQSLFFGQSGLNLFDAASRPVMLAHLRHLFRIAARLGAGPLVFGSPKCRDRSGLEDAAAEAVAVEFFREAGALASEQGVTLCLEANPERYGCNFMTRTPEAAHLVARVDAPGLRLHLDAGTLTVNGESPEAMLRGFGHLVGYVHASEPGLVPLGTGGTDHRRVGAAVRAAFTSPRVSIEMLTPAEGRLHAIDSALAVAVRSYREPAS